MHVTWNNVLYYIYRLEKVKSLKTDKLAIISAKSLVSNGREELLYTSPVLFISTRKGSTRLNLRAFSTGSSNL